MNQFNPSPDSFAQKYDYQHAFNYYQKHRTGFARRLSNWHEQLIAKMALKAAGDPKTVLDIPCGAGRFWPMLGKNQQREIIAADNSKDMLEVAKKFCQPDIRSRISLLQTSAYDIQLDDESVDNVFCMRLLHHIGNQADRLRILKEFNRVSNDTVCVSLWVDGNYKAFRRRKMEEQRNAQSYQNRFVFPRQEIEDEFSQSGFKIISQFDLIKYYSMWRVYTLKKIKR